MHNSCSFDSSVTRAECAFTDSISVVASIVPSDGESHVPSGMQDENTGAAPSRTVGVMSAPSVTGAAERLYRKNTRLDVLLGLAVWVSVLVSGLAGLGS
jgi:hypothetical protein